MGMVRCEEIGKSADMTSAFPKGLGLDRLNVVGCTGSGKTTLARRLAAVLGSEAVEMDALFWESNWTEATDDKFFHRLSAKLGSDRWVLDGNFSRTTDLKWERVQTVIWLDMHYARNFMQLLLRSVRRAWDHEELWPGSDCRENMWRTFFTTNSILWWFFKSHGKNRQRYRTVFHDPKYRHINFVRLSSPEEVEAFVERVSRRSRETAL